MENPSIRVFGLLILEPVTTLTDLLVSAVCFYAFTRLYLKHNKETHLKLFTGFFFSMGFATAFGGLIGHGFMYAFSFAWKLPAWLTSMVAISLLERASIEFAKPLLKKRFRIFMDWANIVELIIFLVLTFSSLNFFFVEVHSAFGLLIINTPLHIYIYLRRKNTGSIWMLTAIGFAMLSAIIFMNEIAISKWFNHFDISHSLMAIGAYFFYRAGLSLQLQKGGRDSATFL